MVSDSNPLAPLQATLRDLVTWWQAAHIPGMVIGGVAAAVLGRPRATRDVDGVVLVPEDKWNEFLASGAPFGFVPRLSNPVEFARESRVLLIHHQPGGIDLDISFGALPFEEEAVKRAVPTDIGGQVVPLPTPEDLIIMKAVAHRPRDLADIEGILAAQPKLDWERIRRWVGDFAAVLEMPEIFDDLENLLAQRPKQRKGKGKA
jgi:hypothetical protein